MNAVDEAIDRYAKELAQIQREEAVLAAAVAEAQRGRENGFTWREVMSAGPIVVEQISAILARQAAASGQLRRAVVVELRAEGVSIPKIAKLFDVSHQRISNILREIETGNGR